MKNKIETFGSLCSGIEAASFVLEPLGVKPLWLSEIGEFQSRFLSVKYPNVTNYGDMNDIPEKIESGEMEAPDLLCGGTPCQAFSLAGWRNGINDDRGLLTLKYIDIVNAIDKKRLAANKPRTIFFWENVEGALTDKTNAFGCFLAGLLGLPEPIVVSKWTSAGVVYGKDRNIAWRVLDAKYFGLPQQRRRIYLLGGGKDFHPENVLFEMGELLVDPFSKKQVKTEPITQKKQKPQQLSLFDVVEEQTYSPSLIKQISGHTIEAFRSYSDCLYAAYGTKWNGNAAAYNGSLYFSQNGRLRRLTPLECERLMGFPDNYTNIEKCRDTQRYHAVGNSWAVPVIRWIAQRLINGNNTQVALNNGSIILLNDFTPLGNEKYINASKMPYDYKLCNMVDIADINAPEKFYITSAGCAGILRRKTEHNIGMNARLEITLRNCIDV